MEKIKSLFAVQKKVFALDQKDELFVLEHSDSVWVKSVLFFKNEHSSKVLVYQSSYILDITKHKILIYDVSKDFSKISEHIFEKSICLPDTLISGSFLCVCFDQSEYLIINLKTFEEHLFSSDLLLLNTTGGKIIEWDSNTKEIVITENYNEISKIKIQDTYLDKVSRTEKEISIEKVIVANDADYCILQANYDCLYHLNHQSKTVSSSIFLKNTFLGDTISFKYGDYHITSEIIWKMDWSAQTINPVLNWSELTGCTTFPGIAILFAYQDIIVFIGTSAKIVVFYSSSLNKIMSFTLLPNQLYKEAPYLLLEDKVYVVDSKGLPQLLMLPKY